MSTIAIIILWDRLHEMIWLDRHVEKKSSTHRNKMLRLCWDRFGNSVILIHLFIWNLRDIQILLCVSQSKSEPNITSTNITYRWRQRVVVCRIVIWCVDVWWVLHFAYISHWLMDAFPVDAFLVVTSLMRVLTYDTIHMVRRCQ